MLLNKIFEYFNTEENIKKLILTGVIIITTIIIFFIIKVVVNRIILKYKNKRRRAHTLAKLIQNVFQFTLVTIIIILILSVWEFDVGPILAGAGIIGLAIGFGAQSLFRDLITGMTIVFENFFDIDDVVEIKGFKGRVMEIGLRATKLVNFKGEVKIFSNGDITEVTNFSRNPSLGIVEVEISQDQNIDEVINLLSEKLPLIREAFPQIIEGPNVLGVIRLSSRGFTIRITVKTMSEQHYSVERGIFKYVKELFEENNIKIPYEHMVIHNE